MMEMKYFGVLAGFTAGLAAFAMSDDDLRKDLLLDFWDERHMDMLVDGRSPLDGKTFEDRYGAFIRRTGWGRERFFRELDALVSNGCSRVGAATNYSYSAKLVFDSIEFEIDSLSMSIAADGLCSAESNEWITCAGWLLTNGVDECALAIGLGGVKKYGVTAQTLENCRQAIAANPGLTRRMTEGLTFALANQVPTAVSTSVSNGMVRVLLAEAAKDEMCYMSSDHLLCRFWQGYAVSSNRYQNLQMARSVHFDNHDGGEEARAWHQCCDKPLRELEKHQPLPLLPTNTINGVAW